MPRAQILLFLGFVLTSSAKANQVGGKPGKSRMLVAFLLTLGAATLTLVPHHAVAGSRTALVMVSVQVVASCRVENTTSQTGDAMDLKMRCSSTARPNLGLMNSSQIVAPVGTVTLPHSQIATTENGKTLAIEF
jgi:hypothetical protein